MRKAGIILFVIAAALFSAPVIAVVYLSFKSESGFTLQNYAGLLFDCFVFYPMFWNSVLYAAVITLAQLIVIIPCAFGFTQARFFGKGALFTAYIILMMMPLQVTILPNYIGLRDMGLLNTRMGIILPMIFSPFGAVVMRQYMKSIDNSVIEAMRMETSSVLRITVSGVIPQIKVCVFAVAVFVFADCWGMLEQPMLFLKERKLQTLSVFIADAEKFSGDVLFPAAVIFMIPILFLYLFFKESLEKGLTLGDVK